MNLILGVTVGRSACETKRNLPFGYSRNSVGNIAIVQNIKEKKKCGDISILSYNEIF